MSKLLDINEWRLERDNGFRKIYSGDLKQYIDDLRSEKSVSGNYKGDTIIPCPYCYEAYKHDSSYSGVYRKKRLYVYQDYTMGHCFRCDNIFVQENDENISIDELINQLFKRDSYFLKELIPVDDVETPDIPLLGKVDSIEYFNSLKNRNETGQKYLLEKRHRFFNEKLIDMLGIRFEENGNVVFPFYIDGKLKFYQCKNINFNKRDQNDEPYHNPADNKPPYIINGKTNKWILCEGVFDAVACYIMCSGEYSIMALLGSSISDYHAKILKNHIPDAIYIMMDEYSISQKIQYTLNKKVQLRSNIIYTDGRDPEERMKAMIDEGYGNKIFTWLQNEIGKINKKEIFSGLEKFM